ncbi:MAG: flavin reductase family protein [Oscillospiraceae bacterium]|jgi:flavin reductase (DIM6/NTAB) family NADH-FMN oxidoreductase RutF|nr:flavin reductase family protein [Oscillospiraceae bacterium]
MTKIRPQDITGSVFERIGTQWMLITAEKEGKVNTMTASWGGLGVMWNSPVAICAVRPQRYTFEFIEPADLYTLSFLPEQYRDALNLCGAKSGRDTDKIAAAGLHTQDFGSGAAGFKEAELTLVCRKLFSQFIKEENFAAPEIATKFYPGKDFHKLYIGEITDVYGA